MSSGVETGCPWTDTGSGLPNDAGQCEKYWLWHELCYIMYARDHKRYITSRQFTAYESLGRRIPSVLLMFVLQRAPPCCEGVASLENNYIHY